MPLQSSSASMHPAVPYASQTSMPCTCEDAHRSSLYPSITTLHPLPAEVCNRIFQLLFRNDDLCLAHIARLISFSAEFYLDNILRLYRTVSLNDTNGDRFFEGLLSCTRLAKASPPFPGDIATHLSYGFLYPGEGHYGSRKVALVRYCGTLRFETPNAFSSFLKARHAWRKAVSLRAGQETGEPRDLFTSVQRLSLGPLLGLALYEEPELVLSQQAQFIAPSLEPFAPQKICIHMPDPDPLDVGRGWLIDRPFDTFLGLLARRKHVLTLHNARPALHEYWLGKADRLHFDLAPQETEREHMEVIVDWVQRYLRYCRAPSASDDDDSQEERPIEDVIISNTAISADLTAEELDEAIQSICQQYAGTRDSPGVTVCGPQICDICSYFV
ncbi:hypothetical protein B9479_005244 [Cryptococcus floricola]|uniref:Uncharacterized protein n=1 Tax=Cryptococcus floricola TaxID=2591691 RepID=A0A5D3AWC5_9TREE|nr:hypothetical protein B9479_005244 [Cryptococcus floricola]